GHTLSPVASSARGLAMFVRVAVALIGIAFLAPAASADERVLDAALHHLRAGSKREWADFPEVAEGPGLSVRFKSAANDIEWSLRLRQQDVRQTWKVLLNGKELGRLRPDENDMVLYVPIAVGSLVAGENQLLIEQVGRTPDDVQLGEISLDHRPHDTVLSEASVEVSVLEA